MLEAAHAVGRGVSSAFAAYVATELADALLPLPWRKHGTRRPLSLVHRAVGPRRVRRAADFVPVPLQRIIARALRREPEERYATVSDMHSALYCYLHGLNPPYEAQDLAREAAGILAEAASLGWAVSPEAHGAGFPLAAVDTFRSSPRSAALLSASSPS